MAPSTYRWPGHPMTASGAGDEERLARTQAALVEQLHTDPLTTRVALKSTGAVVRVTLDRWAADPDGRGCAPTNERDERPTE